MISRRRLLVAAATGIVVARFDVRGASALPAPQDDLAFDIYRAETKVGTHLVRFQRSGDALRVTTAVSIKVSLGPIPLYNYTHEADERWQGDQFVSLDATTNANGKESQVTVKRSGDGLAVQGRKDSYTAPADALPATNWNRETLKRPLINPQNGKLVHPTYEELGADQVEKVGGGTVTAEHFRVSHGLDYDTWYADERWCGLSLKAKDGSVISYRIAA